MDSRTREVAASFFRAVENEFGVEVASNCEDLLTITGREERQAHAWVLTLRELSLDVRFKQLAAALGSAMRLDGANLEFNKLRRGSWLQLAELIPPETDLSERELEYRFADWIRVFQFRTIRQELASWPNELRVALVAAANNLASQSYGFDEDVLPLDLTREAL
ncbi:MAG: hypothetical protein ABR507_03715 [Actinomycetota bacterium]